MKRFVENEPKLKEFVGEINSAAVLNISHKLFKKAEICLKSEGFSEEELRAHKPRFKWFHPELFENADIIIGMTRSHKLMTPRKYRKKFVTLTEAVYGYYIPIPDPFIRTSQESYEEAMQTLYLHLVKFKNKLLHTESKKNCQISCLN